VKIMKMSATTLTVGLEEVGSFVVCARLTRRTMSTKNTELPASTHRCPPGGWWWIPIPGSFHAGGGDSSEPNLATALHI